MKDVILDPELWESLEAGTAALLDQWFVAEGDHVHRGRALARAVLVKSSLEVIAPALAREGPAGWGGQVLLRATGGTAVLVGPWMLTASVALPARHRLLGIGLLEPHRRLGLALVRWLRRHRVEARVHPVGRAAPQGVEWACFAGVAPWEVCVRGRKIAGLAQARGAHAAVSSAGVLLQPVPWAPLCEALRQPEARARALAEGVASCAEAGAADLDADRWASELHAVLQGWVQASSHGGGTDRGPGERRPL